MIPVLISVCFLNAVLPTDAAIIKATWDYSLESITSSSDNDSLIHLDLRMERINRGMCQVSGTLLYNVGDGTDCYLEVTSYRSATGSNNYQMLPFKVNRQSLMEFYVGPYKKLLMKGLASCSDLPQAKDDVLPPLTNKNYTLDKCRMTTESFPSHLVPGFYKVLFNGTGIVNYILEFIVRIESKL